MPRDCITRKLIMLERIIDIDLQEDVELLLHHDARGNLYWKFSCFTGAF